MRQVSAPSAGLLVALIVLGTPAARGQAPRPSIATAQAAVEAGRPAEAIPQLDLILDQEKSNADALLLRSTAHFMLGDTEAGRRDLDRCLELDPTLRQGWLNRAALALVDDRLPDALEAFDRARQLAPEADDNELNLGAVRLLLGDLDLAAGHFERYLQRKSREAQAFYLVATNYAMAGYAAFAIRHLDQAIRLDERTRRQARTDVNFAELTQNPRFQQLLDTDQYSPPPGSFSTQRSFRALYDGGRGPLLDAVLRALTSLQEPYERQLEIAPEWGLVWSRMRLRMADASDGEHGTVELIGTPDRFSRESFERDSKRLLDSIFAHLRRQAVRPRFGGS